ncbi:uncharacterized protein [Onthophagus taurus]|uniref:uncharacterized protein n=1 Tax=Onthophagus taurus TaxID=166361 RepID=UPI000C203475|nr:sodium-dependent phosphate transport protein 1, chloroplastic-like [Onthophagus taurus]
MVRLYWFSRTSRIVALCSAANFINSADRVIMPIAIIPMTDEFHWTLHEQGWILSAFAFGYFTSQLLGSCSASKLGAKNVLIFSVLLWSIATFITPLLAHSFAGLVICRIVLGFAEGLGLPTIFHLFAHTIPVEERSRAFGYLIACGSVGQTVASVMCPHLLWQSSFYLFGSLGFIWVVLWGLFYPERALGNVDDTLPLHSAPQQHKTPLNPSKSPFKSTNDIKWHHFLLSKPLWAIYVAHFSMNWCTYIIMQWLPTYLSRNLGANSHSISLTAIPYIFNSLFSIASGHFADNLLQTKNWSVLNVRRLMTCIGLVGPGLFLAIFCLVDDLLLAVILVSISMGLSAANSAGHLSNHVDVAPNHSGTTFAISNTLATVPGVLCGPVTAHLVVRYGMRWAPVFLLAMAINLSGAGVYFRYGKATQVI